MAKNTIKKYQENSRARFERGRLAERFAEEYLLKKGYVSVAKNWRYRRGELDLVMFDRGRQCVVFVEVRSRTSPHCSHLARTLGYAKMAALKRSADVFLSYFSKLHRASVFQKGANMSIAGFGRRIDMVWVTLGESSELNIEHWINIGSAG